MSKKRRLAHKEMWAYLKSFPDATAEEISTLREWVKDGNSPYENGDNVCDDFCHPMDFINTMRFWNDVYQKWLEDPEGFKEQNLSSNDDSATSDLENPHEEDLPF